MRQAEIIRKTVETDISLKLNIDGSGQSDIKTGCGFLDHMLTLFAKHGKFDLDVKCVGDTFVDYHHTVEDVGICLGLAFEKALGDKKGIKRYGGAILPMDESLIVSAVDLSGRACLVYNLPVPATKVGDFDTELVEEFWTSFVRNSNSTLHVNELYGKNTHHVIEGAFKSVARSMREAVEITQVFENAFSAVAQILKDAVAIDQRFKNEIPSSKGVL